MQFGFEPVCDQVRAGSSGFEFRYAILVVDGSKAGRRPVADLLARTSLLLVIGQIPARCRSATSLGPVCDRSKRRLG